MIFLTRVKKTPVSKFTVISRPQSLFMHICISLSITEIHILRGINTLYIKLMFLLSQEQERLKFLFLKIIYHMISHVNVFSFSEPF